MDRAARGLKPTAVLIGRKDWDQKARDPRDHQQHDSQCGHRRLGVTEGDREREACHGTRQGLRPEHSAVPPDPVVADGVQLRVVTSGKKVRRDQRSRLRGGCNRGDDAERLDDALGPPF
jgi:hypothetical protein